jgi:AAA family ATPase
VKDIERLIRAKLKDSIVHSSNSIMTQFLNKTFAFKIGDIEQQELPDIADQLASINLDENFYLIQPSTIVKIESTSKEEKIDVRRKTLDDVGGMNEIIKDIQKVIDSTFSAQQIPQMKSSRGILLYGFSGCGKSLISEAIGESYKNARKVYIESFKIFSKFYGESENNLRKIFEEAFSSYPTPTILIIDEISNLCPKNDSSDVIKKVSSLLISILDSLHVKRNASKIFVIATTNNLDNVDPAIRRSGRLDYEIEIPVPNTQLRELIIVKLTRNFEISENDVKSIAKHTHGYVGADLENLISKSIEISRGLPTLKFENILSNLSSVKPSAMRELLVEKPNVRWSDIGGMHDLKLKLKQIVEWPLLYPETFQRLGIEAPRGLCMFGPPGNSKTMIAKALATESNLNFISIKGSDLFSMWVGESEKAVRDLFVKARQLSPCICFFDEIDAIGGERESGSSVKERVLAQILTEIDGVNSLKKVIIIAATNRPDLIDSALMRPGRLDRIVYVKLPDEITREEIFKIKLAKIPIDIDVDIKELVKATEGYSGAEIESVCKEAALKALEDSFDVEKISMKFFLKALEIVTPRTSPELLEIYAEFEKRK